VTQSLPQTSLSNYSGEFTAQAMEKAFLQAAWVTYKVVPKNTLLILGLMTIAFGIQDITTFGSANLSYASLFFRLAAAIFMLASVAYIQRAHHYFGRYQALLFANQIFIPITIFILAWEQRITLTDIVVSAIGLTLIYYQFMHNRFVLSVSASFFLGIGSLVMGLLFFEMSAGEFIGALTFLLPLNILGMIAMRSINRSRRGEYLALSSLREANHEKERLIQELQMALDEIKTLETFIPICANCHNIRNDEGFWEKIEKYIHDRTGAQFSHGICPDCLIELYPEVYGGAS
jgi:hypothetical protein